MLYISCLGHIHLIAESMYPFATLFLLPQQPPPPSLWHTSILCLHKFKNCSHFFIVRNGIFYCILAKTKHNSQKFMDSVYI